MDSGILKITIACVLLVHSWHYSFWCSNCPKFGWEPFQAGCHVLLTHPNQFLSSSLYSETTRCSRFSVGISHFPKEPWLLSVENGRNQDLGSGVLLAIGISLFLGPFQWTELGNRFLKKHKFILLLCWSNTRKFFFSFPIPYLYLPFAFYIFSRIFF